MAAVDVEAGVVALEREVAAITAADQLKEFVESVEWDGKENAWHEYVIDSLALNDVKALDHLGRVPFRAIQWKEEGRTPGRVAFAEVSGGWCELHYSRAFRVCSLNRLCLKNMCSSLACGRARPTRLMSLVPRMVRHVLH